MDQSTDFGNFTQIKILKDHFTRPDDRFFDNSSTFISIFIILVNFLVVLSSGILLLKGQQTRATYIFLGNISLADMVIGIATLFLVVYPHQLHSEIACSLSISLTALATMESVLSLSLIAIDRFLYIVYGIHYHSFFTTKKPRCTALLTWFLSAILAVAPIFFWRNPMKDETCWFISLIPPKVLLIPVAVGLLPLLVIIVLYGIILKKALDSRSRLNDNCSTVGKPHNHEADLRMFRGRQKTFVPEDDFTSRVSSCNVPWCRSKTLVVTPQFGENKWKAVKVVAFTVGAFLITWFPYLVTSVFYAFCDDSTDFDRCENIAYLLSNPMSVLGLLNSLLNPLIYAWWHPGFRNSVKKMYAGMLEKNCGRQRSECPKSVPKIYKIDSLKQIAEGDFDSDFTCFPSNP